MAAATNDIHAFEHPITCAIPPDAANNVESPVRTIAKIFRQLFREWYFSACDN